MSLRVIGTARPTHRAERAIILPLRKGPLRRFDGSLFDVQNPRKVDAIRGVPPNRTDPGAGPGWLLGADQPSTRGMPSMQVFGPVCTARQSGSGRVSGSRQRRRCGLEGESEAHGRNESGHQGNLLIRSTDPVGVKPSQSGRGVERSCAHSGGNAVVQAWEGSFPIDGKEGWSAGDSATVPAGGNPSQGVCASVERGGPQGRMRDATSPQAWRWSKPSRW